MNITEVIGFHVKKAKYRHKRFMLLLNCESELLKRDCADYKEERDWHLAAAREIQRLHEKMLYHICG